MGLHTGAAEARDGDYHGYLTLAHVQRVMSTAYGGQTLVSNATAALLAGQLPEGVTLRDMGEHRLKGLLNPERLWQMIVSDLPHDFPALQSLNTIPNNLPIQVTSFVGRERELAELQRLLVATRLLTLTGSGGTGKTRLSLQVAAEVLDKYRDGVWFVELAPLADPVLVPQTVASVLGVREQPGRPMLAALSDWLQTKQLLLILDNCEHLLDACAKLADAVLHASRETRILTSSREALGIAGETAYRVPSLESPSPTHAMHDSVEKLTQYAAVQLFIERATQSRTTFTVTNANAPAVVQICYRLDGIPLAIELAASRVKALSVDQIAARLDDRFRLLTGGSRTALARQQTLRALIDWSYSLLAEPERVLLRRLSVFAGGWTLEAAEAVCAGEGIAETDVLELISRLVDKSLVVLDEQVAEPCYAMLETIRQYARDKLMEAAEGDAVRAPHLAFYVRLAEEFYPQSNGPNVTWWLARLETEIDNVRTAIAWALESRDFLSGMRIVCALHSFWIQRHTVEGLAYLREILAQSETVERGQARANALRIRGNLEYWQGDYPAAQRSYEEALAIAKAVNADQTVARLLKNLGETASAQKNYASGRALLTEALDKFRTMTEPRFMADTLGGLADIVMSEGDAEEAYALYEDYVKQLRIVGIKDGIAIPIRRLGQIALQRGDYAEAAALFQESLASNMEAQDQRGAAACLAAWAAMYAAQGRSLEAARLYGAVNTLLESWHTRMLPIDQDLYERSIAALRARFDAATFDAAESAGRALTLEQAIALALEETHV
ncbi:MAG: tetratricopeptide repeat protein [Chloroflexi bacterium]|nr:tetratricopeptide repeat protein [Chloroflexota bacterium]